jgi:tetratricopeptide (TPR) repeat protein
MMRDIKKQPTALKSVTPKTIAAKVKPAADPARRQQMEQYEAALRLMQERKFEKARVAFDKLLQSSPTDMAERVRVHLAACERQLLEGNTNFGSLEEQYDYAISLLNTGYYDDAKEHFNGILKKNKDADYAYYGLSVLSSMTGERESCLEHLTEAIRLNSRNRIQARSDSDFQDMSDDPRFTELLYPEIQ